MFFQHAHNLLVLRQKCTSHQLLECIHKLLQESLQVVQLSIEHLLVELTDHTLVVVKVAFSLA